MATGMHKKIIRYLRLVEKARFYIVILAVFMASLDLDNKWCLYMGSFLTIITIINVTCAGAGIFPFRRKIQSSDYDHLKSYPLKLLVGCMLLFQERNEEDPYSLIFAIHYLVASTFLTIVPFIPKDAEPFMPNDAEPNPKETETEDEHEDDVSYGELVNQVMKSYANFFKVELGTDGETANEEDGHDPAEERFITREAAVDIVNQERENKEEDENQQDSHIQNTQDEHVEEKAMSWFQELKKDAANFNNELLENNQEANDALLLSLMEEKKQLTSKLEANTDSLALVESAFAQERQKWEKEKADLTSKLEAATDSLALVGSAFAQERQKWEKEKADLTSKLEAHCQGDEETGDHSMVTSSDQHFKKMADFYETYSNVLVEEITRLTGKLHTATTSAEHYQSCYNDAEENCRELRQLYVGVCKRLNSETSSAIHLRKVVDELEEKCSKLEEEKNGLCSKLSSAKALVQVYRDYLHNLDFPVDMENQDSCEGLWTK